MMIACVGAVRLGKATSNTSKHCNFWNQTMRSTARIDVELIAVTDWASRTEAQREKGRVGRLKTQAGIGGKKA